MVMRTAAHRQSGMDISLEGRVRGRLKSDEAYDLVVSFPGKTTALKYQFEFKNLKLPYPVKRTRL